jgi:membrane-anchored protein YejM (alkaline phosphatase superfamily)
MKTLKGFLYTKHRLIGSKSEGEGYFLQTYNKEYIVSSDVTLLPYKTDKVLTEYTRKMVQIEYEDTNQNSKEEETVPALKVLLVKSVKEIENGSIPKL